MPADKSLVTFAESIDGFDKFGARALAILDKQEVSDLRQLKKTKMEVVEQTSGAMSAGLHGWLSTLIEDYQKASKPTEPVWWLQQVVAPRASWPRT